MLKTYFKIAWRNLSRSRLFAFVNIGGLAVALASFMIILIYFNYELSYDKWDPALGQVYKIGLRENQDISGTTPAPLASFLAKNYAHAEAATAIMPAGDYEILLSAGEKRLYQKGVVTVDSSFLKVFPYRLVQGDPLTALNPPNAVVLSEALSRKLFGNQDPVGRTVKIYNMIDGLVTGVMRAPAGPSHLDAQMLMRDPSERRNKFWENHSFQTYIKLRHPLAAAVVGKDVDRIYYDARLKKDGQSLETFRKTGNQSGLFADAVADLHNFPQHGETHFKITMVLLILAVFLLVAGAINFSNLSLARAITRAREVGVRKVLGSGRGQIILQSLFEIALQCLVSLGLAVLLVNITLPWFSSSFDLPLTLRNHTIVTICMQMAFCLLLIVLVSGLYPALFLSGFQTAEVLKGKFSRGNRGVFFRNSLLLVQLTLSALFITGIVVVNRQMDFMQGKDLGFNASGVLRIEATQKSREENFPQVRSALLSVPGVEYVSKSTAVPGSPQLDTGTNEFRFAGKNVRLNIVKVGVDYFRTMDIKLIHGRLFENGRPEDLDNTAVINESALRAMGAAGPAGKGDPAGAVDPVGKLIYFPGCDTVPYTIVGVVKDFNVQSLETRIVPAIYSISNAHCSYNSGGAILVKISAGQVRQTMAGIGAAWKNLEPAFPIRYSFLDANFRQLIAGYIRLEKIILLFSVISILIAVTGLFALTSFLAQQRVKEIGIRKVLGASVGSITGLLSKDFVKLLVLAIVIATPLSWWALSRWLEDFAYRIDLRWWMFGLAGLITMGITLLTVCSRAIRVAMGNPVESLRTE